MIDPRIVMGLEVESDVIAPALPSERFGRLESVTLVRKSDLMRG